MMHGDGGEKPPKKLKPGTLKRVLSSFRPYKGQVGMTLVTVFIAVLLGLLPPLYLIHIVDDGIRKNNLHVTAYYSIWTIVMTILAAGLTLLYGYWSVLIGQK